MEEQARKIPQVFVGIPTAGGQVADQLVSSMMLASTLPLVARLKIQSLSFLTKNFNDMFCHALNCRKEGITHFCLLHADVVPEPLWLDKMIAIMKDHQADVLSAVIPVKSVEGFTSTALDVRPHEGAHEDRVKRLSMHEIYTQYPPTFTHESILLNTGLMLIDLSKPWVENIHFDITNSIERDGNGNFYAMAFPEDWLFSRRARNLGARLFATREIGLAHVGTAAYKNNRVWGTRKEDYDTSKG